VRGLAAGGAEIHAVCIDLPSRAEWIEELRRFFAAVYFFPVERRDTTYWRGKSSALLSSSPEMVRSFRSEAAALKIAAVLGQVPFDLAHFEMLRAGEFLIQNHTRLPSVLSEHNLEYRRIEREYRGRSLAPRQRAFGSLEVFKTKRFERLATRAARLVVHTTEQDAAEAKALSPHTQFAVIPNGVDHDYFQPVTNFGKQGPPSLIFTGTLSYWPNEDAVRYFTSDILPLIRAMHPNVAFIVAGQDPPASLVTDLKRVPNVKVMGNVPDMRPLFADADVFVCPLRAGGGSRLKLLDAMAMAKPVVSTSLGAEGIALDQDTGFIANTPLEFSRAVGHLLDGPEVRERLGRNGRALVVEHYDWRKSVDELACLYGEIVARAHNRSESN